MFQGQIWSNVRSKHTSPNWKVKREVKNTEDSNPGVQDESQKFHHLNCNK